MECFSDPPNEKKLYLFNTVCIIEQVQKELSIESNWKSIEPKLSARQQNVSLKPHIISIYIELTLKKK